MEPKIAATIGLILILAQDLDYCSGASKRGPISTDVRIVGGYPTPIANFPHQVSLQRYNSHTCGGAIYKPNIILTAAHCVPSNVTSIFSVRVGSTDQTAGGVTHTIKQIIVHENFSVPSLMNNDIALLVLDKPIAMNNYSKPIELDMRTDNISTTEVLFVSGWGSTMANRTWAEKSLRYTTVQLIDHNECVKNYEMYVRVTENMFCAGVTGGGRDSCQGDSGGPIVSNYDGVHRQLGVISWGVGCAEASYPGVYTNITQYSVWINQQVASIV